MRKGGRGRAPDELNYCVKGGVNVSIASGNGGGSAESSKSLTDQAVRVKQFDSVRLRREENCKPDVT